ncbi:hypothetical protein DFR50_12332 [Roseiarcus fermentans]|uniref:Uncharacterized protein n=2 Tax=Roseiarcus fermentans TaxID=1473586 RepID=A0A366F311_9HYPH|nr:hypothetical protein DFR50_12332 [Roseiarcus fermentans]
MHTSILLYLSDLGKSAVNRLAEYKDTFQVTGSVSQIISAGGAIVFGLASISIAWNVFGLQKQQRLDAALGRASEHLIGYSKDARSNAYGVSRGLYCIDHLNAVLLAADSSLYWTYVSNRKGNTFTDATTTAFYGIQDVDIDDTLRRNHDNCLERNASSLKNQDSINSRDSMITDRYLLESRTFQLLDLFTTVLTEWDQRLPNEVKQQIDDQIHSDICDTGVKDFFLIVDKNEILKKAIITGSYDRLDRFINERCN